ncbi:MAG: PKD domain-containing protein [Gammaproteobacteria bacterium]|nr:PKD domain-containing protein [Gammaproteobacteria bacterium]MDH5730760.1 PKD domain-containing protein [Gammaproteobacteria bacterium]
MTPIANQRKLKVGLMLTLFGFVLLALYSCGEQAPIQFKGQEIVSQAFWDSTTQSLSVSGQAHVSGISVQIADKDSGTRLGRAQVDQSHQWVFNSGNLTRAPCTIEVKLHHETISKKVKGAPASCEQIAAANNFTILNDSSLNALAPNGIITSPADPAISINFGETLQFSAIATDPGNNTPLSFRWLFDGAAPNTTAQNPGTIKFSSPGIYRIKLIATNSLGIPDETPDQRVITVQDPNALLATPPEAQILSPQGSPMINVGDSLNFSANAVGGTGVLSFLWDFNGVTPNTTVQNPGDVVFSKAGVFTISLTVTDETGVRNTLPAEVVVSVGNLAGQNQAPSGIIRSPTNNQTILLGSSVLLEGGGTDPEDNLPLSYFWNLDGAAPNTTVQNPGSVQFNSLGVFNISLTVTDALGLADPNPPVRTITVSNSIIDTSDFPESTILTPATDVTIDAGASVDFTGEGLSPAANDPLTFLWTFDGAAPDSMDQNPGPIMFADPGVYSVTFTAIDSLDQGDPTPDQRIITVVSTTAATPESEITRPRGPELTLIVGETYEFRGEADDVPLGGDPVTYLWTFDGGAEDSVEMNPLITFDTVGTYAVTFTVTDATGVADPTPAEVTVIVEDGTPPPADPLPTDPTPTDPPPGDTAAPDAVIVTPDMDMEIAVGDSIDFSGDGIPSAGATITDFMWDFDGVIPNSIDQNPGLVTFDTVGVFEIILTVTDTSGAVDPTPAMRIITVIDPNAPVDTTPPPADPTPVAEPPMATIVSPDGDVTIFVGESVELLGEGSDPSGDTELSFKWEFHGAVPDIMGQNPGMVTFETVGVFEVELEVTNSLGLEGEDFFILTVEAEPAPAAAAPPAGP